MTLTDEAMTAIRNAIVDAMRVAGDHSTKLSSSDLHVVLLAAMGGAFSAIHASHNVTKELVAEMAVTCASEAAAHCHRLEQRIVKLEQRSR